MDPLIPVFALIIGMALGALVVSMLIPARLEQVREVTRATMAADTAVAQERTAASGRQIAELEVRLKDREAQVARLTEESSAIKSKFAEAEANLEAEKRLADEKLRLIAKAEQDFDEKLKATLKATASDVMQSNTDHFMKLALTTLEKQTLQGSGSIDAMLGPVKDTLGRFDTQLRDMELKREGAYEALKTMVEGLKGETSRLAGALKSPGQRGRWGEIQLQRVVEMAGMVEHCDFVQQTQIDTPNGMQRPDVIVKLPNDRTIVIDAKAPMDAYLAAMDATDDATRNDKLREHAQQVRRHVDQLSAKAYWAALGSTPEFVVAFLPGESFFSAALEQEPLLIEHGVKNKVVLATPTTLIALLKAISFGWRQEKMAASAQAVSDLGKQLYDRVLGLSEHLNDLRGGLVRAVDGFNRTVGSIEGRVLVTARRFKELGAASGEDIEVVQPVDRAPREISRLMEEKTAAAAAAGTNGAGE